jgi:predicted RNase H-like HicB family nuclease
MEPIRVIYHREPEGWWAESHDVPGWSAAGATFEEVYALAEEGIPFALEGRTVQLVHFRQVDKVVSG